MRPARVRPLLAALVLCGATAAAHGETVLGGEHWRLGTSRGTVHVWRPEGYDSRSAGVVVYIHGYYTSADSSWNDDRLANQFHESRRNALFIVPEAPSSGEDPVVWPSLDSLLITVQRETRTRPLGPLVVVGHSGAWRTVEAWLRQRTPSHLVLLDAMYGEPTPIRSWLISPSGRRSRLTLVAADTLSRAQDVVRGLRGVVHLPQVPADETRLSRSARQARILLVESQYEHHAIISEGRVIPVVLRLTPLAPYAARPAPHRIQPRRGTTQKPPARRSH